MNTEATVPPEEISGAPQEAWHRPVVSRLPLSETLSSGGSGTDGGLQSSGGIPG